MKTGYLTLIFALACAACTPRFYPPKVDVPDGYLYGEGFPRDTAALASDWWRLFGDTVLDNLVQRALENNRDVAVAASRVEEARQNLGVVRAQFLPQVGIGVTAEGEYTPQTKIVQTYAVEPSLSWEIALFGQLRNAKRAARAQIASSEWALRGVRLSLAAEVATTYFTLLEYERDLAIARRSCTLRRESAALIDSMFRYGMSDGVALEQARSLVYTAEADIPQYERAVKQTRLSLDILLGETPQAADSTGSGLRLLADRRHPRRASVGTAQAAPGHHGGALQYAPGGRECRGRTRGKIPVHRTDSQRRNSLQLDQRFNCGKPLGVGCAGLAHATPVRLRQAAPLGDGGHGALYAGGKDLRANRTDGIRRCREGAGRHRHLPHPDRAFLRTGRFERPHCHHDAGALPQRAVGLPRRD